MNSIFLPQVQCWVPSTPFPRQTDHNPGSTCPPSPLLGRKNRIQHSIRGHWVPPSPTLMNTTGTKQASAGRVAPPQPLTFALMLASMPTYNDCSRDFCIKWHAKLTPGFSRETSLSFCKNHFLGSSRCHLTQWINHKTNVIPRQQVGSPGAVGRAELLA